MEGQRGRGVCAQIFSNWPFVPLSFKSTNATTEGIHSGDHNPVSSKQSPRPSPAESISPRIKMAPQKPYPRATVKKIVKAHSNCNVSKNADVMVSIPPTRRPMPAHSLTPRPRCSWITCCSCKRMDPN